MLNFRGTIGCPHCQECRCLGGGRGGKDCDPCRFWVLRELDSEISSVNPCLRVKFGGIAYLNTYVCYSANREELLSRITEEPHLRTLENTRRFLEAHILWADRILDGTYREWAARHGIRRPRRDSEGYWRQVDKEGRFV
jgi:hypothetical protein